MAAWIKILYGDEIDENLSHCLELAETPHGTVDNVMRIHSLRPSTMIGHVKLYKAVLHDDKNVLPKWFQETVSSYVSILNNCDYYNNSAKDKDPDNTLGKILF